MLCLGLAYWWHGEQKYQAGRDSVAAELLSITKERDELRVKAEEKIIEERVVYRDRIKTIQKSPDTCVIPSDILRVLAEAGIYVGPL